MALLEEKAVIPFFEKTWFLWWIFAIFVILRWFHLFSSQTPEGEVLAIRVERSTCGPSEQIASGTR